MYYYTAALLDLIHQQRFQYIKVSEENHVLDIMLDRPKKKNALHPIMLQEIAYAIEYASYVKNIWAVTLQANGNVFCAGADLNALQDNAVESTSSVPEPQQKIILNKLFDSLTKPCIAIVEGDVYAGGLLLLTGCTYVIAKPEVRFSLPEVKRGLFPFQVLGVLCQVIPPRKALDWCISGKTYTAKDLIPEGFVTHLSDQPKQAAKEELERLFENSPHAIQKGIEAFKYIQKSPKSDQTETYLYRMLLQILQSKDAQEGLNAFREKRKPQWFGE